MANTIEHDIFRDIAERTGGDIYLGIVGPVRTGKSTFIKKFMELMILPNIPNPNERDRARDELPQSGAGRTITTTEPKFIPNEAVEVDIREGINIRTRLVDCVGYTVGGAQGYEDESGARMVHTPWFEEEVPFQQAAEVGTRKVIEEHSTIGIVVTTDGSIGAIPRSDFIDAEERVVWELKELKKPFVVILNSTRPYDDETANLATELEDRFNVPVVAMDCAHMMEGDVLNLLEEALYEFPVAEVCVNLPRWVEELDTSHWLREKLDAGVREAVASINRLRDIDEVIEKLAVMPEISRVNLKEMSLGNGTATIEMMAGESLFHQILSEVTGFDIMGDHSVLRLMTDLASTKKDYDKVSFGLQEVRATGYGVVSPTLDEMELEEPELVRQGNRFGVRLKASAPSYHLIKVNVTTEITPLIGTEKQCEDLVAYIMDEFSDDPKRIWDTNIFGKSLYTLVREGVQGKLGRMPENAQVKLQETIQRIVNEGGGGLVCIII